MKTYKKVEKTKIAIFYRLLVGAKFLLPFQAAECTAQRASGSTTRRAPESIAVSVVLAIECVILATK